MLWLQHSVTCAAIAVPEDVALQLLQVVEDLSCPLGVVRILVRVPLSRQLPEAPRHLDFWKAGKTFHFLVYLLLFGGEKHLFFAAKCRARGPLARRAVVCWHGGAEARVLDVDVAHPRHARFRREEVDPVHVGLGRLSSGARSFGVLADALVCRVVLGVPFGRFNICGLCRLAAGFPSCSRSVVAGATSFRRRLNARGLSFSAFLLEPNAEIRRHRLHDFLARMVRCDGDRYGLARLTLHALRDGDAGAIRGIDLRHVFRERLVADFSHSDADAGRIIHDRGAVHHSPHRQRLLRGEDLRLQLSRGGDLIGAHDHWRHRHLLVAPD
mmetsp:Transcript_83420/g.232662  ORF Transcript_83420/g.232662 Transcript_83420/m.232662 type:complete len:326 (-) Transcript_83420:253-1230(-)